MGDDMHKPPAESGLHKDPESRASSSKGLLGNALDRDSVTDVTPLSPGMKRPDFKGEYQENRGALGYRDAPIMIAGTPPER
jgi:hypothetical protein